MTLFIAQSQARKRPMGEQAVPEWGLHPWIEIQSDEAINYLFDLVVERLEPDQEKEK